MKTVVLVLLMALISGCDDSKPIAKPVVDHTEPVHMDGDEMRRYETNEVICFRVISKEGIWCHWKGETK